MENIKQEKKTLSLTEVMAKETELIKDIVSLQVKTQGLLNQQLNLMKSNSDNIDKILLMTKTGIDNTKTVVDIVKNIVNKQKATVRILFIFIVILSFRNEILVLWKSNSKMFWDIITLWPLMTPDGKMNIIFTVFIALLSFFIWQVFFTEKIKNNLFDTSII